MKTKKIEPPKRLPDEEYIPETKRLLDTDTEKDIFRKILESLWRIEDGVDRFVRGEEQRPKLRIVHQREKYIPDVAALYHEYPRKLGKGRGMKTLLKQLKNEDDFLACGQAILNLKKICEREHRAEEHIPYFSTFANNWRDYVPPETFRKETRTTEIINAETLLL